MNGAKTIEVTAAGNDYRKGEPEAFAGNLDCLQSLRGEAKLLLRMACLRREEQEKIEKKAVQDDSFDVMMDVVAEGQLEEMSKSLVHLKAWNRRRAELSKQRGCRLHFFEIVDSNGLDDFESGVLLLLYMKDFDRGCGSLFRELEPGSKSRTGATIGTLLEIMTPDFESQISNRAYFGMQGNLRRQSLVVDSLDILDDSDNILDERIAIQNRIANYLVGDDTIYNSSLRCINREDPAARLEQVVLPEETLKMVLEQVDAFSARSDEGAGNEIDDFFGYGTGLAMLFHGPSGTGKTMLAHALARRLGTSMISVDLGRTRSYRYSVDDVVQYAFREAKLGGGVVFFDECDDLFREDSNESRALLVEIEKARCMTILTTNQPVKLDPALERRIHIKVPFSFPDEDSRSEMWKRLLPEETLEVGDMEIRSLAKRYIFSGGLIKNAVLTGLNLARSRGADLSFGILEDSCRIQADSLIERSERTTVSRPVFKIEDFSFPRPFRDLLERLKRSVRTALDGNRGAGVLLRCGDVPTALDLAEAVAGECEVMVRHFDLRDVLSLCPEGEKQKDSEKTDSPRAPFKRHPGHRTVSVIADRGGDFDRFVSGDKDKAGSSYDFAGFFEDSSEVVFVVTGKGETGSVCPILFDMSLDIPHPPLLAQVSAWSEHAGKGVLSDDEALLLAEQHPMHIREIAAVAAAVCFERGGGLNERNSFAYCARKILAKNRQMTPVLFGKGRELS